MHRKKIEYCRMLIGLGSELANKGELEKAKEALEAAIMLNPKFDGAYTHLASVHQKLGQPQKASQVLEHCLERVNPQNGEVAYTLGMNYFTSEANAMDKAQTCFELCLQMDDCDADSMLAMAQICQKKELNKEEESWYTRILKTPGVSNDVMAMACSNLAYTKEGQDEEIELLLKALEHAPSNFETRYSLGSAYASRKNWKNAAKAFRLAVDSTTEDTKEKTLKMLYRVAMNLVQEENPQGFKSQNDIVAALQEVVGVDNYKRLAALKR